MPCRAGFGRLGRCLRGGESGQQVRGREEGKSHRRSRLWSCSAVDAIVRESARSESANVLYLKGQGGARTHSHGRDAPLLLEARDELVRDWSGASDAIPDLDRERNFA